MLIIYQKPSKQVPQLLTDIILAEIPLFSELEGHTDLRPGVKILLPFRYLWTAASQAHKKK